MSGTSDRAEGAWDETKGKVKEAVGDAADDRDLEAEGKKDQLEGKGEKAKGHLEDAAHKVKEGVDDLLDR